MDRLVVVVVYGSVVMVPHLGLREKAFVSSRVVIFFIFQFIHFFIFTIFFNLRFFSFSFSFLLAFLFFFEGSYIRAGRR